MQIGPFRFNQSAVTALPSVPAHAHRVASPAPVNSRFASRVTSRGALRIAMLVAALVGSPASYAQNTHSRLGMPEVLSLLGSPLWVKIPIEATDATEEVTPSRFTMGTRPTNAGIPFLENAEISFERLDKKYFLVIRSRLPVNEPAIGIVIREQVQHGVRSREFSLLLDPPPAGVGRTDGRASDAALILDASLAQTVQSITAPPAVILPPVVGEANAPLALDASRIGKARPPRTKRSAASGSARTSARADLPVNVPPGIAPIAKPAPSAAAPRSKRADRPAPRTDTTDVAKKGRSDGPKLRLSLDAESVNNLPVASEEMRADLRRRQLILDTDDLTSALLERHHRITLLEKELVSLAARVSAAERTLNVNRPTPAPDGQTANPAVPAPEVTSAPVATVVPPVIEPAKPSPKIVAPAKPVESPLSLSKILLIAAAAMLLAGAAFWFVRRHLRARAETFRILPQQADDYVAEVMAESHKPRAAPRASSVTNADFTAKTIEMKAPAFSARHSAEVDTNAATAPNAPEIHFELPPTASQQLKVAPGNPGVELDFASPAPKEETSAPANDLRARRMRYLESRYQDIAILKPALDAPQRLLSQAGRVHDEGAAEFAKRLLKYAAYSRPHTEEFWLGLLEILYREKFANDYLVNAKWFRKYHPQSKNWDEVQRIGYLLDPAEPLFASAAAWSHEAPAVGIWLPVHEAEEKPLLSRTHMKLELAN